MCRVGRDSCGAIKVVEMGSGPRNFWGVGSAKGPLELCRAVVVVVGCPWVRPCHRVLILGVFARVPAGRDRGRHHHPWLAG